MLLIDQEKESIFGKSIKKGISILVKQSKYERQLIQSA
jgi:hypothetical protein